MTRRTLNDFTKHIRAITERQLDFCGFCTMQACQRNYKLMHGETAHSRNIHRVWKQWDEVVLVPREGTFLIAGGLEVEWASNEAWELAYARVTHHEWADEDNIAAKFPFTER